MMQKNKPGYVLVLTILISAFCMILITSVMQRSFIFQRQTRVNLDREKARAMVLGSLELVKDQISFIEKKEDKQDKKGEKSQKPDAKPDEKKPDEKKPDKDAARGDAARKEWIKKLLEICNVWQTIKINDAKSGVEATISMYVACEQGKINLRQLIDAIKEMHKKKELEKKKNDNEQGKQKGDGNKEKPGASQAKSSNEPPKEQPKPFPVEFNELMLKELRVDIVKALEDFTKRRGNDPEDATELITLPELKPFKNQIFIQPLESGGKEKIALMDLFTTASGSGRLNPWLLSNSLAKLLGLAHTGKKNVQQLMSKFKNSINWAKEFNTILAPTYGKNIETLPKQITALFGPQFEATGFSVLSIVHIGKATEKIFALFEPEDSGQSANKLFRVAKIYWL